MKKSILFILLSLITSSLFSAEILEGSYNTEKEVIELKVAYGGGCAEHYFNLKLGDFCLETYPVQCFATLEHDFNNDFCEAYIVKTIEFTLEEAGLVDSYFSQASLTISGANESSVKITLPVIE